MGWPRPQRKRRRPLVGVDWRRVGAVRRPWRRLPGARTCAEVGGVQRVGRMAPSRAVPLPHRPRRNGRSLAMPQMLLMGCVRSAAVEMSEKQA